MCIANTNGYFEKLNHVFEKVLGFSKVEMLKDPFISFIHPDDLEATFKEVENLSKGQLTINFKNNW